MDATFLAIVGLLLYYLYKKGQGIPQSWMETSIDYWYVLPVGSLPFEDSVMQYKVAIMKAGQDNGVEAAIIAAMIGKESKGVANSVNGRFLGLMQFGVTEAQAMGYKGASSELIKPDMNIAWGTKYLKYCIDKKGGDLEKGISGYNTGQVEKPDTPFNVDYVSEVASYVPRFRYLLSQAFPGYATVFPKETWLKTTIYA